MQSWVVGGQVLGLLAAFAAPTPWAGLGFQVLVILAAAPVSLRLPSLWSQDSNPVILHRPCLEPVGLAPGGWTDGLRADPRVIRLLLPLYVQWSLVALAAAPLYAVYPLLMKSAFGMGPATASLVFAVASLLAIATSAALVHAAQRVAPITLWRTGILLRLAAVLLLLYATSMAGKGFLGALAFGVLVNGWVFVSVGFNAALAERVPQRNQGAALGVATGLMSLAVIVGSALGGLVSQRAGYPSMLMIASAILALGLFMSLGVWSHSPR